MFKIISQIENIEEMTNRFREEGISEEEITNLINKLGNNILLYKDKSYSDIKRELLNKGISSYIKRYPKLGSVPLPVLEGYLEYLSEGYGDKKLYILQILLFWSDYPELIGSDILSEYSNLIFSIINKVNDIKGLGVFLVNNYDKLENLENLEKLLLIYGNDYSKIIGVEDLHKIDYALHIDIKNYNNLADFLLTYRNSIYSFEIQNILYKWDKLSDKDRLHPEELLFRNITGKNREYVESNYDKEMFPLFSKFPRLLKEKDPEIVKLLWDDVKNDEFLGDIDIDSRLKAIKVFGLNYEDIIDRNDLISKERLMNDYIPTFVDSSEYEGMGEFIIKFKDYLNLVLIQNILKNWDKIKSKYDINEILLSGVSEKQRELLKGYPERELPILITNPSLIGEDPRLISNVFDDQIQKLGFGLTNQAVINIGKLIKIFGEDYNQIKDDSRIQEVSQSLPNYSDKKEYEGIKEFLIKFIDCLYFPSIMKILRNWNISKDKNFGEIMLENIPEDRRERIIRGRYSLESYPLLIEIPSLIGMNPQLVDDILMEESGTGVFLKDIFKIASIFGKDYKNIIGDKEEKQIHELSNYFPNYENRRDYKYLDLYLRKNKNWDDSIVNIVMNNWNKFPEELKKVGDTNALYDYFVNNILSNITEMGEVKDKEFALEAFKHDIDPEYYWLIEGYYLDGQKVPLPLWAEIEPVIIKGYMGHFLPRSDRRTMFIGDYVTCCQKIGSNAETSAIHSQVSPYGALFLVEDMKTRKPYAQSWVWSNKDNIVFDDIESPVMIDSESTSVIPSIIMEIYGEAAKRMKEKGASNVLVGYSEYGINEWYLDDLETIDPGTVTGPEDEEEFLQKYFGKEEKEVPMWEEEEEDEELYMDSDEGKKILAGIYNKMLRLSNRIDKKNSDISDMIDRVIRCLK